MAELAGRLAPAPLPVRPGLMLCSLVKDPFDDPDWIFEPKFDGLRVACIFDGRDLQLISRNGIAQNFQFPDIVDALRPVLALPCILDGEIVCLDEHGRSSFRDLQQRFHLQDTAEVQRRAAEHPAYLYAFDLLYLDRYDITPLPLIERKRLLKNAVRWNDRIHWTPARPREGIAMLHDACRLGLEGIVGKRLHSPYVATRSGGWVKIKCSGRQEFVIGGFTDPAAVAHRLGGAARGLLQR